MSVSQDSFRARCRWQFVPLSEVFLVCTGQSAVGAVPGDDSFADVVQDAGHPPLQDVLVFKVRWRPVAAGRPLLRRGPASPKAPSL